MSHDATARCSDWGENAKSEMPSSGGLFRVMSFDMSPVELVFWFADAAVLPKRPDMIDGYSRVEVEGSGDESDL